jgi:hypothetical protein
MKARHVWVVISVCGGVATFGEVVADDGVMWGMPSIMNGMAQGAAVTALCLVPLVFGLVLFGSNK